MDFVNLTSNTSSNTNSSSDYILPAQSVTSTIGAMGSTGNSTEVHLHFVIKKDGTAVNPNNYVNFKGL